MEGRAFSTPEGAEKNGCVMVVGYVVGPKKERERCRMVNRAAAGRASAQTIATYVVNEANVCCFHAVKQALTAMEKEKSEIVARFADSGYVTKADLYRFYAEKEPDLKDSTLRWRIYRLKETNLLRPVSRGVYSMNTATEKLKFEPPANRRMDDLYSIYATNFKMEACALWTTEWIAQSAESPFYRF